MKRLAALVVLVSAVAPALPAEDFPKPYSPPCVERENVFEFTQKPMARKVAQDRYEITFAVKGGCDVTAGIVDGRGTVVRHLGAGVLGANAPAPFQKNSLKQTIYWDGKDDLSEYVKEPGRLRVRVALGLRPTFDRVLLGSSPRCLPGYVWGIAIGPDGAYVFSKGNGAHGHVSVRKFGHDGSYQGSLVPPPANLPQEKLAGMGYIEYEQGVRAVHSPDVNETVSRDGYVLPGVNGKSVGDEQPALIGSRLFFCNAGSNLLVGKVFKSQLHYIYTDGSTDVKGLDGKEFAEGSHILPRLAASPDGRWIYMVGVEAREQNTPAVYRTSTDGDDRAKPFVGDPRSPGADDAHLNDPAGLDCDPDGRLYVADRNNNRVQVFSPEGKLVKTIPSDRPTLVRVHQKTGAVYVLHNTRIEGASVGRLTRFSPFPELKEVWHQDRMVAAIFAVDSWTANPRLWLAGAKSEVNTAGSFGSGPSVTIWEDDGKSIRKILDFDEEARKEEGANHIGRWGGAWVGPNGKVIADPVRERVYLDNRFIFDLRTGQRLGLLRIPAYVFDDIAVDKRGYIHFHMNPGLDTKGVGRVAPPAEGTRERDRSGQEETVFRGQEVPYDYGVDISPQYNTPLKGGLPVRDQGGPNGFQDGLGVNMRGDVAIESKIWYVPKMEDVGFDLAAQGWVEKQKLGIYGGDQAVVGSAGYQAFLRTFQDMEKRGEEVYTFRRRPGSPMAGGTVWVHHRTGELRGTDCTAAIGQIVDGVMIDEDQKLYFVNNRIRLFSDKPFLAGRGGRFGVPPEKWSHSPNTGTLIKSTGANVMVLEDKAPIPLDEPPGRPAELWKGRRCWVEGAEWFYAGASPITFGGCACPAQRLHTDWYKRTFVPETYRHSIGVLDTAGNLILHIGRYGNYDSGFGPGSRIPAGGDGIGMFQPRYIGGTDNYLCFSDWGERMVALKLDYHAEATVDILPPGGE